MKNKITEFDLLGVSKPFCYKGLSVLTTPDHYVLTIAIIV